MMSGPRRAPQFYPGLAAFTDAVEALPQETIRHFTLLREVDAKACGPEELLRRCIDQAIRLAPHTSTKNIHQRDTERANTGVLTGSVQGSGDRSSLAEREHPPQGIAEGEQEDHLSESNRRQRLQQIRVIISDLLLTLDEKIHVISTASEALAKHMVRVDDAYGTTTSEIDSIIRDGNPRHWAYGNPQSELNAGQRPGASASSAASVGNAFTYTSEGFASDPGLVGAVNGFSRIENRRETGAKRHAQISDISDPRLSNISATINPGDLSGPVPDRSPHTTHKRRKGTGQTAQSSKTSTVERSQATARISTLPSATSSPQTQSGNNKKNSAHIHTVGSSNTKTSSNRKKTSGPAPSTASSPVKQNFPETHGSSTTLLDKPASTGPTSGSKGVVARNPRAKVQTAKAEASRLSSKSEMDALQDTKGMSFGLGTAANRRLSIETSLQESTDRPPQPIKTSSSEKQSSSKIHAALDQAVKGPVKDDKAPIATTILSTSSDKQTKLGDPSDGLGTRGSSISSSKANTKLPSQTEPAKSSQAMTRKLVSGRTSKSGKVPSGKEKESEALGDGENLNGGGQGAGEEDDQDGEEEEGDPDEMRYCYCNQVSYGKMVACDGPGCQREWFHLPCVGLTHMPSSKDKWFCNDCRAANLHGSKQTKSSQSKGS